MGPRAPATGCYDPVALVPAEPLSPRKSGVESMDIEALYRRYGDMVYSRCRALLHNDADAQEMTQEVFLRVWRYRDGFRGEASPVTYLYKVTTTTCLNRLRTQRRHPEDIVDELPAAASLQGDRPSSALELAATRQLLDKILAEEDDRTVSCLVYHYIDGMTHEEIGEILGVTASAVRKRLGQFRSRVATARADSDAPGSASGNLAELFSEEEP